MNIQKAVENYGHPCFTTWLTESFGIFNIFVRIIWNIASALSIIAKIEISILVSKCIIILCYQIESDTDKIMAKHFLSISYAKQASLTILHINIKIYYLKNHNTLLVIILITRPKMLT